MNPKGEPTIILTGISVKDAGGVRPPCFPERTKMAKELTKTGSGVNMDMVSGPLLSKLIIFSIPMMFSGLLQLLFNAADIAVVGKFTGSDALAAVSAAGPVTGLIVMTFMGLAVGANVICAQLAGAGRKDDLHDAVHTAITMSVCVGVMIMLLGLFVAGPLLEALDTPEGVLPLAKRYLVIYFVGVPSMMVYNFGAAVLRALGDTRRPLYYLTAAGVLNVILNLFFVIVCKMGVDGVAAATSISQTLSAVLVIITMVRSDTDYHIELRRLRIHRSKLMAILRVGIPAGIQSSAFSIANMLIQSSINRFGESTMAASTIANNIDSFCYVAVDALAQASISFTGQNYGAGNYRRIDRIFAYTLSMGCGISLVLGIAAYIFAPQLLRIYTDDPEVISLAQQIMFILCVFGFTNAIMNIPANVVRGMGRSLYPTISTIFCVCVLRIIWIYTVFQHWHTVDVLFAAWPVSKVFAAASGIAYYFYVRAKLRKAEPAAANAG